LLDEVGDLPQDLQGILLRALQERAVRPIGSDAEVHVDTRVVAATHQDLAGAVRDNRFRADLYARLAQAVLHLPPLRERHAEVLTLARELTASASGKELRLTADAAECLARYRWPFNVRELQSLINAFIATEGDAVLGLPYLTKFHTELTAGFRDGAATSVGTPAKDAPSSAKPNDRAAMEQLLIRHQGNVSAAAAELGKPRALLYKWLRRVGLDPERFR
jgi:transcriptional regulator of acetoin/glycerol metabolism